MALIKPQFEAGRAEAARGDGVIRDSEVHRKVLQSVLEFAIKQGYSIKGLIRSPLLGPKGNVEFLAWLTVYDADRGQASSEQIDGWISSLPEYPGPGKNRPPADLEDNISVAQD